MGCIWYGIPPCAIFSLSFVFPLYYFPLYLLSLSLSSSSSLYTNLTFTPTYHCHPHSPPPPHLPLPPPLTHLPLSTPLTHLPLSTPPTTAGGTAAVLTTPFDLLTTNVMLEAESAEVEVMEKLDDEQENDWKQRPTAASAAANGMPFISPNSPRTNTGLYVEVVQIFAQTFRDLLKTGGPAALFTGAIPRLVFFAPAGMIFFATYESFFEVITFFQNNKN